MCITPQHALWQVPLPQSAAAAAGATEGREAFGKGAAITYRQYFEGVVDFLTRRTWAAVAAAQVHQSGFKGRPEDIQQVSIHLEKHGAFYHPARVEVQTSTGPLLLVVNVAVSPAGRQLIVQEFDLLKRMQPRFPEFLPAVYDRIDGRSPDDLPMFIGQWLPDYHEFHLSHNPRTGNCGIRVWHPRQPNLFLNRAQTTRLFSQIAAILTRLYDPLTGCYLQDWHHAAGDFVINIESDEIQVRLITVRRHQARVTPSNCNDAAALGQTLQTRLLFLLHLSLQIRLDRLDGTGERVWLPDVVLEGALTGFWQAIEEQPVPAHLPAPWDICLALFLQNADAATLQELCHTLSENYFPDRSEARFIQTHLPDHVQLLYRLLQMHIGMILTGVEQTD